MHHDPQRWNDIYNIRGKLDVCRERITKFKNNIKQNRSRR